MDDIVAVLALLTAAVGLAKAVVELAGALAKRRSDVRGEDAEKQEGR